MDMARDLRQVMEKYGAAGRYELHAKCPCLSMAPGEVLVEFTDARRRVQTRRPMAQVPGGAVATAWDIGALGALEPVQYCFTDTRPEDNGPLPGVRLMFGCTLLFLCGCVVWVLSWLPPLLRAAVQ